MIQHNIQQMLESWNSAVKNQGIDKEYTLEVISRKKKYYINKVDFFEKDICELIFILKGKPNLLLWRKEVQCPPKVKGTSKHQIEKSIIDELYKFFLYECIGVFCLQTEASIKAKDYAPYDLEKDRLESNPSFKDMVIEATNKGDFYEVGNQFDVFQQGDNGWLVYTAHIAGSKTNGIALIPGKDCKVLIDKKPNIKIIKPHSLVN